MKRTTLLVIAAIVATFALPAAAHAQEATGPSGCGNGSETYYQFTYSDGLSDTGCAAKETTIVTQADNPGLVASELQVSCSDVFRNDGVEGRARESDLGMTASGGERLITSYLIIKDVSKSNSETCGDVTSIPAGGSFGLLLAAVGATGALAVGTVWSRRRTPSSLLV